MENEINDAVQSLPTESTASSGIWRVFYEPKAFFTGLLNKKAWIVPFILIVIIGGIVGHFVRPIVTKDAFAGIERQMEQSRDALGEAQYNEIMNRIESKKAEALSNKITWYMPLVMVGIPFVMMLIIAGIGKLAGSSMLGGKAAFWLVINVIAFTGLIGLAGDIIRSVMILAKDTSYVYLGLGLLKPINDGSFLHYLLRQIELFSVWRLAATCIGLGAVYGMSGKKFAYVIVPIWIVFILLVAAANLFTGGSIVY